MNRLAEVVFVHGIGQQGHESGDALLELWVEAFRLSDAHAEQSVRKIVPGTRCSNITSTPGPSPSILDRRSREPAITVAPRQRRPRAGVSPRAECGGHARRRPGPRSPPILGIWLNDDRGMWGRPREPRCRSGVARRSGRAAIGLVQGPTRAAPS